MATNKTQPTDSSPQAHIDAITHPVRKRDAETLLRLLSDITGEPARMWGPSIIGFGDYHYKYASGHEGDSFLAGFAPRKAASVIYLIGVIPEQAALLKTLGKHRMGKGCLYITNLENVDLDVLRVLFEKSMAALKEKYR